jgi:hypothetical protein
VSAGELLGVFRVIHENFQRTLQAKGTTKARVFSPVILVLTNQNQNAFPKISLSLSRSCLSLLLGFLNILTVVEGDGYSQCICVSRNDSTLISNIQDNFLKA